MGLNTWRFRSNIYVHTSFSHLSQDVFFFFFFFFFFFYHPLPRYSSISASLDNRLQQSRGELDLIHSRQGLFGHTAMDEVGRGVLLGLHFGFKRPINIYSFRGFIEKFYLFLNRSEALGIMLDGVDGFSQI